ncbi:NUDIX hydrolase [Lentisphaerota bacterium ZTH]|nr:NUDIX hydrolase [Lentisphaerota bacterium]WET07341.1 NUDIX hydrolase [Lentisphaerota bacterium ZTH]
MADKQIIEQAGAVPCFLKNGDIFFILVTARNSARNWIFPKGFIDPGHDLRSTARLECYEEAGLLGELLNQKIGSFKYTKYNKIYRVTFLPMLVTSILDKWPEDHERERTIVKLKDALTLLENDDKLTKVLKKTASAVKPKQDKLKNGQRN